MEKNPMGAKYNKYIVKNPFVFYSVLILSILVFLYMSSTTIIETADGMESLLKIIITKAGRGL